MLNPKFVEMYGERVADAYAPLIEECARHGIEIVFSGINPEVDGLRIPRLMAVSVDNPKIKSALFQIGMSLVRTIDSYEKRDLIDIGTMCSPELFKEVKGWGDLAWVG